MALGGKREGAGRKPGVATLEREKAREYIAERIGEHMPGIFNALVKKSKSGDVMAIRELFDRAFGRAAQSVSVDTKGTVTIVFDDSFSKKKK